jgi:hypothetical protein
MGGSKEATQKEDKIPRIMRRRENTKEAEVQIIMKNDEMKRGQKEIKTKRGEEQERTNK